ncbi:MAG: YDG domain-containing protein [Bacteroidota bacterium]
MFSNFIERLFKNLVAFLTSLLLFLLPLTSLANIPEVGVSNGAILLEKVNSRIKDASVIGIVTPTFYYSNPRTFTSSYDLISGQDVLITFTPDGIRPTVTSGIGSITTYTITSGGSLPSGLSFSNTTGEVTGSPIGTFSQTIFTVTGTGASGTSSTTIYITVNASAGGAAGGGAGGSSIMYTGSPYIFTQNMAISPATPTTNNTNHTISPALPVGLSLNMSTGVITGTPTGTQSETSYVVTGTGASGTSSTTIYITVNAGSTNTSSQTTNNNLFLNYTGSPFTATVGSPFFSTSPPPTTNVSFTSPGGGFSISPQLPSWMELIPSTGNITTVFIQSVPSYVSKDYVVTASGSNGTATTSIRINFSENGRFNHELTNFNNVNKIYGDIPFALVAPSTINNANPIFTYTSSNLNVATISGTVVTIVGAGTSTITATQQSDLYFNSASISAVLTVGKASLSITGVATQNKVYDGSIAATLSGTASYVGLVTGDVFGTVSGTAVAVFSDASVGSTKSVTVTGYAAPSANYTVTQPTGLTADITAKGLSITGLTAQNKVYDGTTAATLSGTASYVGLATGDVFGTVSGTAVAVFSDASIGTSKSVTVTGYTAPSLNYTLLSQPSGLTANIIPAPLTISGMTVQNKVYDGTTAATLSGTASYVGLATGDVFGTVSGTAVAVFNDASAGTNKSVSVTGYVAPSANYTITQPSLSADITAKSLSITGVTTQNKVYDGTTAATLSGTASYVGLATGDVFGTVSGTAVAVFSDATVGSTKSVTVTGYVAPSANYTVTQPTGLTARITAKVINGIFSSIDKVYDGNDSAKIISRALIGVLINDTSEVKLAGGYAKFENPEIGQNKTVSLIGAVLTGVKAGNYSLTNVNTTTASILSGKTSYFSLNKLTSVQAGIRAGYTVTRRDAYNNPALSKNELVYLFSNKASTKFHDAATNGDLISKLQIDSGKAVANFWISDTVADLSIITVSDNIIQDGVVGVLDASDTVMVKPDLPIKIQLKGPSAGIPEKSIDSIQVTFLDKYGNRTATLGKIKVQLSSTINNATFKQGSLIEIPAATSEFYITYSSPVAGSQILTAKWMDSTGLNQEQGKISADFSINLAYASTPEKTKITGTLIGCTGATNSLSASKDPSLVSPWKSLNEEIVTIDKNGQIKNIKSGVVKIVYTDYRNLTDTVNYTVRTTPVLSSPIIGDCIIAPEIQKSYGISAVSNATSYKWIIPEGWTSDSSITNLTRVIPNSKSGILSVIPYNGVCQGVGQSLSIGVLDMQKVQLVSNTNQVKGDSLSTAQITLKIPEVLDNDGKKLDCNNYTFTFFTNHGRLGAINKLNDSTYTTTIRASAGEATIRVRVAGSLASAFAKVVFTGPQGEIDVVNSTIIKGESPKFKFNITQAQSPVTVVYRVSDTSRVLDTVLNVENGVEYVGKPFPGTASIRLVSVFDQTGARRTTQFSKGFVDVNVIEPSVTVVLEASKPVANADSTFGTKLSLSLENTGNVGLSTLQVNADLSSIFPSPTQYIVDSIVFNGETIKLNSNFDGKTNTNLFAWNELLPKRFVPKRVTIYEQVPVSTNSGLGNAEETGVQQTGMNEETLQQYVMQPVEVEQLEEIEAIQRDNRFYFQTSSSLPVGKKSEVNLFMRLKPNGYKKPYVMQVAATAAAKLDSINPDAPVALASAVSTDAATAEALAAKRAAEKAAVEAALKSAAEAAAKAAAANDTTVAVYIADTTRPNIDTLIVVTQPQQSDSSNSSSGDSGSSNASSGSGTSSGSGSTTTGGSSSTSTGGSGSGTSSGSGSTTTGGSGTSSGTGSTTNSDTTKNVLIENTSEQPVVEVPTVIALFPDPVIGASLQLSDPVKLNDDSYDVTLNYKLKNYGNINLSAVKLMHRLSRELPLPTTYRIKSIKSTYGLTVINPAYDGNLDSNLLLSTSVIPYADSATFEIVINLKLAVGSSIFKLQALAMAESADGDLKTTDLTTNGINPDPSGDEIPSESIVSSININVPVKKLISGDIALVDPQTSQKVNDIAYCDSSDIVDIIPISNNTGGLFEYSFTWESSTDGIKYSSLIGSLDSTLLIEGLTDTTYIRRKIISGDQFAYSNIVRIDIRKAAKPSINASVKALEANGSALLTSTSAKTYIWSTGQTDQSITVSTAGRYAVTITDENGCKANSDTVIVAPPVPARDKTLYILGAIDNPTTIIGSVKPTASKASFKFYNKAAGGSLVSTPTLPSAVGKFQFYVAQDVDGILSEVLPFEITMLDPTGVVTVEKVISKAPELQSDASFLIGFDFNIANLRGEKITNVDLRDDLSKVFPSNAKVDVISLRTTGKLNPNTFYNGYAQTGLLSSGSEMAGNSKDTVRLMLRVNPNGFVGELTNIAEQTMTSPIGTFKMKSYDAKVVGSKPTSSGLSTKFNMPLVIVIIPNGFTPNGDGINDKFVVVRPYNKQIELRVLDRNGVIVYQNLNYNNDWNGVSNQKGAYFGKELPNGTYFYSINAIDKTSSLSQTFRGSITIRK